MSFYATKTAKALGKAKVKTDGITNPEILSLLQNYRQSVASAYSPVSPDDISDQIPKGEVYVSKKIDGELWFLIKEGKDLALSNSKGKVIFGDFPILKEAKTSLKASSGLNIIAGELYLDNGGKRTRASYLSKSMGGGAKAKLDSIRFTAFDVLCADDKTFAIDEYIEKSDYLNSFFKGNKILTAINTKVFNSSHDLITQYKQWVTEEKNEGMVVRSSSGRVFKIKPSFSIDAVIIGYTIRSEDATQVRSIALALMNEDGTYQFTGSCGNIGSSKDRKALMKTLKKNEVDSSWRVTSNSGAMYRFVKPTLVVEIKITDLQSEDSVGNSIEKMKLYFDKLGWSAAGKSFTASLHHPVLLRTREDKEVNESDIRMAQLSDLCFIQKSATKKPAALPESEIIRREVYTKKVKDSMAVRKLVLFQTNKHKVDLDYPAFVLHWTDYSPGRKNPLSRQVRLAPTKKIADFEFESILSANIKAGWGKN